MKKKVLSICLVVALVAIAAISTTLAYFTDTDAQKNTMVIGKIEIDQFEKQIVYNEAGEPTGMEDYVDPTTGLMPAADQPAYEGVFGQWSELDANNTGLYEGEDFFGGTELWADHMNAEDKVVFVKNTGNNDVYYRTIILYENPIEDDVLAPNCNSKNFDWDAETDGAQTPNSSKYYYDIEIDGVKYCATVATYTEILTPDEISRPSLVQIAMYAETTQEQAAAFGDKVDILCFTQAVQADGFADAHTALNTAFGTPSSETIQAWAEEMFPAENAGA